MLDADRRPRRSAWGQTEHPQFRQQSSRPKSVLATRLAAPYDGLVSGFIRFIGLLNAAVWLGASAFALIGLPALFADESTRILTRPYAGFAAETVLARLFLLQYWCGGIAAAHLLVEHFVLGRGVGRLATVALGVLIFVGLAGGLWLQPKLRGLHVAMYWGPVGGRAAATAAFRALHGVSMGMNLLVVLGLLLYFYQLSVAVENGRFVRRGKIGG